MVVDFRTADPKYLVYPLATPYFDQSFYVVSILMLILLVFQGFSKNSDGSLNLLLRWILLIRLI